MPDLTEFLLARITEDEELARSGFSHPDRWVKVAPMGIPNGLSCSAVLAECEAKRRILELHHDRTPTDLIAEYLEDGEEWTPECAECSCYGDCVAELPCPTLRLLALPYADHPDYDETWRAE